MPDPRSSALRDAIDAVVPRGRPDFQAVYARVPSRPGWRWMGLGLGVGVAAAVLVFVSLPQPTTFSHQVAQFVDYVYQD